MLRDFGWVLVVTFVGLCALINTLNEKGKQEKEEKIKDTSEEIHTCDVRF